MDQPSTIKPANGKLGILMPGMGAVATTEIAGVEAIKAGLGQPIGSLSQMGTIRLGKRTEGRSPLIKDFVPLAGLDDLVFGGWDVFPDDAYEAAAHAGVLEKDTLNAIEERLRTVKPMKAVLIVTTCAVWKDRILNRAKTNGAVLEVREDIQRFKEDNGVNRNDLVVARRSSSSSTPCTMILRAWKRQSRKTTPQLREHDLCLRSATRRRALSQRRSQPDR